MSGGIDSAQTQGVGALEPIMDRDPGGLGNGSLPVGGWFCLTIEAFLTGRERGGWALYPQTDSGVPVVTRYKCVPAHPHHV
jgi:hypothetical protein